LYLYFNNKLRAVTSNTDSNGGWGGSEAGLRLKAKLRGGELRPGEWHREVEYIDYYIKQSVFKIMTQNYIIKDDQRIKMYGYIYVCVKGPYTERLG